MTRQVPGPFYKARQDPNNILITASFGRIIPVPILNLFDRNRRLNVHASLLPHYRGPAPIQHAIADGRIETGVSILNIDPVSQGIDSGDIWCSRVLVRSARNVIISGQIHTLIENTSPCYIQFTARESSSRRCRSTCVDHACHGYRNSGS
jgi:Formyl transferase